MGVGDGEGDARGGGDSREGQQSGTDDGIATRRWNWYANHRLHRIHPTIAFEAANTVLCHISSANGLRFVSSTFTKERPSRNEWGTPPSWGSPDRTPLGQRIRDRFLQFDMRTVGAELPLRSQIGELLHHHPGIEPRFCKRPSGMQPSPVLNLGVLSQEQKSPSCEPSQGDKNLLYGNWAQPRPWPGAVCILFSVIIHRRRDPT